MASAEANYSFERFRRAWHARWEAERSRDAARGARARAVSSDLAQLLRRDYRVRRVVLFGSLARGEFRRDSDIDLAVEGLSDGDFFAAGAALERIARDIDVDLVQLERAPPALAREIERDGIVLP